ncbi:MAG: fibronectin type III domain-containing protein [Terriglobales bacterium]
MRALRFVLAGLLITCFAGCGGSSHTPPQNPTFTSTPILMAAQGTAYSYTLAATDPSGGTVSFALTSAPMGAALSGSTINWTPAASESRVSNSFTAEATTSSGGSATQSWLVTPVGTVTVNWVDTNWTSSGPISNPDSIGTPAALAPAADGSLTLLPGTLVSPGVYNIANVPGGNYWLIEDNVEGLPPVGFWTGNSTFDLGRDTLGANSGQLDETVTTTFDFNLSGLDASDAASPVGFLPYSMPLPDLYMTPLPGDTMLVGSQAISSSFDWTTANTAFLIQYEPVTLGTLNNLVAGPELTLTNLALTNGTKNQITDTLAASPQTSLELSIPGTQWAPLFENVAPAATTPVGSWLSLAVEPYVTGVNTYVDFIEPNFALVQPISNGLPPQFVNCPSQPFFLAFFNDPPMITDQDFGSLQYGDPFPSEWTRTINFCQSVTYPFTVGGATFPFAINFGESVAPSDSPLAPIAGPVVNPTINGSSLFTTTNVTTTVEALSWSAPASGTTPYGYTVFVYQVIPIENGFGLQEAADLGTSQTSVTLTPLLPGNTYVFFIIAEVDGVANMQTSPYRSQLPTGFATVMSNQITISSGAKLPELRGDREAWRRLLSARGKTREFTGKKE